MMTTNDLDPEADRHNKFLRDFVTDQRSFTINCSVPLGQSSQHFETWSAALTGLDSWGKEVDRSEMTRELELIERLDEHEKTFVCAFLRLSQVFFTLIRLPIFDLPAVRKVTKNGSMTGKFQIEISVPAVQFIAPLVYEKTLSTALDLCAWIMQFPATLPNRKFVFDTVEQKLIRPLAQLVPAGQSTVPTLRAARALGIPFLHVGLGVYQLGWASKAVLLDRSTTAGDSAISVKLTKSKVSTANMLKLAALPAPVHTVVRTFDEALNAALKIGFPVVVKPIDQERGEGVTVDVKNNDALKTAFQKACDSTPSRQVLVERQVAGVCHRIFIVGKQLLYAVKRLPLSVQGDGVKTVRQLVDEQVAAQALLAPWLRHEIRPLDDLAHGALSKVNLNEFSIPAVGTWVPLRPIESSQWGGLDEDVTTLIHPDNVAVALAAAKLLGLYTAGVDMISPDITKPWHENGAIINEVNFAPLLGGAQISKSYLPRFFAHLIDGDGRIPIVYIEDLTTALDKKKWFANQGLRCFLTTPDQTINSVGQQVPMLVDGFKQRCGALIYRADVDAIVMTPSI